MVTGSPAFADDDAPTEALIAEPVLSEHLVLLSLYQTCRVRGISFLRFLLSRERDMDAFTTGKRPRHRAPRVELFPKGYTPPALISPRRENRKGEGAKGR